MPEEFASIGTTWEVHGAGKHAYTGRKVLLAEGSRGHSLGAALGSRRLLFQEDSGRQFLRKKLPKVAGDRTRGPVSRQRAWPAQTFQRPHVPGRPPWAPSARCPGLHLHAGRRLLGHHEATSPFDAVVLVLLGAAREVASPLRRRGGSCQTRKSAVSPLTSHTRSRLESYSSLRGGFSIEYTPISRFSDCLHTGEKSQTFGVPK